MWRGACSRMRTPPFASVSLRWAISHAPGTPLLPLLPCPFHGKVSCSKMNSVVLAMPFPQVLFCNGVFQWERLRNLIKLAQDGTGGPMGSKLNLNDTIRDAVLLLLQDTKLRNQLLLAVTEGNRLVCSPALPFLTCCPPRIHCHICDVDSVEMRSYLPSGSSYCVYSAHGGAVGAVQSGGGRDPACGPGQRPPVRPTQDVPPTSPQLV